MGKHESKHTPGPWHVVSDSVSCTACEHGIPCGEIASDSADLWIAKVQYGRVGKGRGDANARLIAAAPELLAACEAARDALADMTSEDFSLGRDRAIRDALDAAIKRAVGERKPEGLARARGEVTPSSEPQASATADAEGGAL